ncbi:MAG: DUF4097 family beta strand repeat protein [Oscillospiraceae bacterium]|nr:DUF4097 family beta strand repeat protein [Oscillospiraceae bacterium]
MKKYVAAIVSVVLLISLALTGCASMAVSATPETNSYSFKESISEIDIDTSAYDVVLCPSESGICEVVCRETEQERHSVKVQGSTLRIQRREKNRIRPLSFNNIRLEITVYLPQRDYQALTVKTSSGSIDIAEGFKFESAAVSSSSGSIRFCADVAESLTATASSGKVYLNNLSAGELALTTSSGGIVMEEVSSDKAALTCSSGDIRISGFRAADSLAVGTSSGDIQMTDVQAKRSLAVSCTSGDITLEDCDAREIRIETTSGDVLCSFLSGKSFRTETSSGSVTVPEDSAPYPCEIRTTSGNIMVMAE